MKKFSSSIILIAIFFMAFHSCKDESHPINTETKIQLEGLTLNNNEKWVANEETHVGMKRIDSILKNNTSKDGKVLGNALSKETSHIIKSCDMTGEAHDQLHVVLVPILEEITEIKDLENTAQLKSKTDYLKRLVKIYFEFFTT
ncbi:hypothetical protein [uncultured Winogradskyella sp.]|uniref:hypothetical protein n=1 Tax=uncultured Winogradskyella sp. TaxID=395353 RepID=UPI002637A3A8|nr:hypothetical protein [uncultured Winogradskyella sp.]